MIGLYAVLWCLVQGLSPVLVPALGLYDLLRRNRAATLRLLGLLWVFLFAELLGVTLAGLLWGRLLLGASARLLQLRLTVEGDAEAASGPVVVFMRHTSIVDTVLPLVFLGSRHGMRLRYVLKKGLQLDPCLDLVGNRLPNYFVDRSGETDREIRAVGRLAEDLGERDGVLIYPEGTRFSVRKLQRARDKLAQNDPLLHELSQGLTHVLPPRPGGALALLDTALPAGADVVFFAHTGLDHLERMHDVLSGEVLGSVVRLRMWRVPGRSIPVEREARLRWLYQQWERVDAFAAEGGPRAAPAPVPAPQVRPSA